MTLSTAQPKPRPNPSHCHADAPIPKPPPSLPPCLLASVPLCFAGRPYHTHPNVSIITGTKPTLTDVGLITCEADLPEDLYKPGLKLFVCSTDLALQRKVVDACDTLTTSLGPVR